MSKDDEETGIGHKLEPCVVQSALGPAAFTSGLNIDKAVLSFRKVK
jgi:hypothetical protein